MDKEINPDIEEPKQKKDLKGKRESNPKGKRVAKHKNEKTKTKKEETSEKKDNAIKEKGAKILGISIWRILAYFIIYSVIGFIIETLFGLATKGVLESRKSFLYGPFCGIYGLGAVIMITSLQYFKKNNITLFIGGYIVGSIVEYVLSLLGEFILHVKWWDYSNQPFNINGRICFSYSMFWGVLAIILITYVNKKVDILIDYIKEKIPNKIFHTAINVLIAFLIFDCLITAFALKMFYIRLVIENELEVENAEEYIQSGKEMYETEVVRKISNRLFTNEKMLKTFPNLKMVGKNGEIIYVDDILKDIEPYYIKLFDANKVKEQTQKVKDKAEEIEGKIDNNLKEITVNVE